MESQVIEQQQEKMSQGVIRDVWYGQRSLAQTYWGWNFLFGSILVGNVGLLLVGLIAASTGLSFLMFIYLALVVVPVSVWVLVGCWRSATNNPGFWAGVVKFLVVIGVIVVIAYLIIQLGSMIAR